MIKYGCKATLLCGGGRLQTWGGVQISSSSPKVASFRPLGATGNDQVNASQRNQASKGYVYLTVARR